MSASDQRVLLVDDADAPGRTTATLIASLSARLATLHFVTGATAVGSLTAGFAALGREVARTAEGARIRQAIERGRASSNGDAIWAVLGIGAWASGHAPSPILDQLRNDIALLLADDVHDTLAQPGMPNPPAGTRHVAEIDPPPVEFSDYLLGMWAYAREVVRSVEALAAPTLPAAGGVIPAAEPAAPEPASDTPLLR
jgi:hypothetical protein